MLENRRGRASCLPISYCVYSFLIVPVHILINKKRYLIKYKECKNERFFAPTFDIKNVLTIMKNVS